jgi:predicted nucleic acid-binding protein
VTIAYFDTSAFVSLILEEATSTMCERLWLGADRRVSSAVLWPESAAALARAHRTGRLDDVGLRDAVAELDHTMTSVELLSVTPVSAESAAGVALRYGTRGFDSVHVEAALQMSGEDFFAVTGDAAMARTWRHLGIATVDVTTATP